MVNIYLKYSPYQGNWWFLLCCSTNNFCQFIIGKPLIAYASFWQVKHRTIVALPIFHTFQHPCKANRFFKF